MVDASKKESSQSTQLFDVLEEEIDFLLILKHVVLDKLSFVFHHFVDWFRKAFNWLLDDNLRVLLALGIAVLAVEVGYAVTDSALAAKLLVGEGRDLRLGRDGYLFNKLIPFAIDTMSFVLGKDMNLFHGQPSRCKAENV